MPRVRRPTATVRNSARDDSKIVETSAPLGAGLLIELHPAHEGSALYVVPYRADRDVFLMIKQHAADCEVLNDRRFDRRCDCGACLTYNPSTRAWEPTKGTRTS